MQKNLYLTAIALFFISFLSFGQSGGDTTRKPNDDKMISVTFEKMDLTVKDLR